MAAKNLVEHRAELDDAAAHVERGNLEGHDIVVAGKAEFAKLAVSLAHRTNPLRPCERDRNSSAADMRIANHAFRVMAHR